jgi:hypothetical protein
MNSWWTGVRNFPLEAYLRELEANHGKENSGGKETFSQGGVYGSGKQGVSHTCQQDPPHSQGREKAPPHCIALKYQT